jgi:hypothetical protein
MTLRGSSIGGHCSLALLKIDSTSLGEETLLL